MYELYIGNKNYSSWSLRPWVLMRTRDIAFAERLVPFEAGSSYRTFRAFSPTGKVPCLRDGDTVVWDSLGISEYLAEAHPGLWPDDRAARAWARCATAEMHSGFTALRTHCGMNVEAALPDVGRRLLAEQPEVAQDLARIDAMWSQQLAAHGGPFLFGDFTIATRLRAGTSRLPRHKPTST